MDRKEYLVKKFGGKDQAFNFYKKINDAGKKIGIFFQFEKITKTPNSFASHKLLALAYKKRKQNQIIDALFYAYFVKGKNIGKLEELVNIAEQNNIKAKEAIDYLQFNNNKKNLLQDEKKAKKMGIKSVPCFIINNQYVLFGAQEESKFIEFFNNLMK